MQYILTEKELQNLRDAARKNQAANMQQLQWLCTQVANHKPVEVDWMDKVEPWGCILDPATDPTYCDHCPAIDVCPHEYKEFSK